MPDEDAPAKPKPRKAGALSQCHRPRSRDSSHGAVSGVRSAGALTVLEKPRLPARLPAARQPVPISLRRASWVGHIARQVPDTQQPRPVPAGTASPSDHNRRELQADPGPWDRTLSPCPGRPGTPSPPEPRHPRHRWGQGGVSPRQSSRTERSGPSLAGLPATQRGEQGEGSLLPAWGECPPKRRPPRTEKGDLTWKPGPRRSNWVRGLDRRPYKAT